MAQEPRRSERVAKIRRDSSFYYEEEVLNALTKSPVNNCEVWQPCSDSESNCVFDSLNSESVTDRNSVINSSVPLAVGWSDIVFSVNEIDDNSKTRGIPSENCLGSARSPALNTHSASISDSVENINISGAARRNSSTSAKFLDLEGHFLSAEMSASSSDGESVIGSNSGGIDNQKAGLSGVKIGPSSGLASAKAFTPQSPVDPAVDRALMALLEGMSAKLDSFEELLGSFNNRLSSLESSRESEGDSQHSKQPMKSKNISKKDRVEFEKIRSSKVLI